MKLPRRGKLFLIALVTLLMVSAIFATGPVLKPLVSFYAHTVGQRPPNALQKSQAVTRGDTTITLVRAVTSASHTVLEFTVENPAFPHTLEAMYHLSLFSPLSPGKDLRLTGFTEQAVFSRRESRQPGMLRLILELPPPASFDQPVTVEIEELKVLETSEGTQGRIHTLEGPWRFTFIPHVSGVQRRERRIPVQQTRSSDGIHVTVSEVLVSSTETVVTYRLQGPANEHVEMLGAPRLSYQGQTFDGREKGNPMENPRMVSFPGLPMDTQRFELLFGPFWVSQTAPITVTLEVAKLRTGGQTVRVGEHVLQFQELQLTPDGFQLRYVPGNVSDARFTLTGPGATVWITDDLGQRYVPAGESLDLDPQHGMALKAEMFRVAQPLNEKAARLSIQVDRVGKIFAPVRFQVENVP